MQGKGLESRGNRAVLLHKKVLSKTNHPGGIVLNKRSEKEKPAKCGRKKPRGGEAFCKKMVARAAYGRDRTAQYCKTIRLQGENKRSFLAQVEARTPSKSAQTNRKRGTGCPTQVFNELILQ